MAIQVTPETLRSTCDALLNSFDRDWIERLKSSFAPEAAKDLHEFHRLRARAHPFALELHALDADLLATERTGKLSLSPESIHFLEFLTSLREQQRTEGMDRIFRSLEDANSYYSAKFEIFALSWFQRNGLPIRILEESKTEGERTPDFEVTTPQGRVVVECKSLDDKSKAEERLWAEIQSRVIRLLDRKRRFWRVCIQASRLLSGRDIDPLIKVIAQSLDANDLTETRTEDAGFAVRFTEFGTEEWRFGPFVPEKRGEYSWSEADQRLNYGCLFHRHARMVEAVPFFVANEARRISAKVRDAYHQVPEGTPGLVMVQIPHRRGDRFLEICDKAFNRIHGSLKDAPKINAVVLCAQTLQPRPRTGESMLASYFAVIPNSASRVPFPDGFRVPGSSQFTVKDRSDNEHTLDQGIASQGTIVVSLVINEPLSKQIGRNLLYYCEPDGTFQFRAWQSYTNKFRVDVVAPEYGRRTFESDLNHLSIGVSHKLAVAWDAGGLAVYVDGESLTRRQEPAENLSDEHNARPEIPEPVFTWSSNEPE